MPPSRNSDDIQRIMGAIAAVQVDMAALKTLVPDMQDVKAMLGKQNGRVRDLELEQAKLQGALSLMWKVLSVLGISGIGAVLAAFWGGKP